MRWIRALHKKVPAGFKNRAVLVVSTLLIAAVAATMFLRRPERPEWAFAFYFCGESTDAARQTANLHRLIEGATLTATGQCYVLLDRDSGAGPDAATGYNRGAALYRPDKNPEYTLQNPVLPELPLSLSSTVFQSQILQGLNRKEQNLICNYYYRIGNRYYLRENSVDSKSSEMLRGFFVRTGYVLPLQAGDNGQLDMADPSTLRQFLTWVRETSKARNIALVVSGPAMYPFEEGSADNDVPDVATLRLALEGNDVDVLVLDRDYSSVLANAAMLNDVCEYLVLCQTAGATVFDYRRFCLDLQASVEKSPALVALTAMNAYSSPDSTAAAITLECGRAFSSFIDTLMQAAEDKQSKKLLLDVVADVPRIEFGEGRRRVYVDLFDLVEKAGGEILLPYKIAGTRSFVTGALKKSPGFQGLSVFFPERDLTGDAGKDVEDYAGSRFAIERGEPWLKLVKRYAREDGIRQTR